VIDESMLASIEDGNEDSGEIKRVKSALTKWSVLSLPGRREEFMVLISHIIPVASSHLADVLDRPDYGINYCMETPLASLRCFESPQARKVASFHFQSIFNYVFQMLA